MRMLQVLRPTVDQPVSFWRGWFPVLEASGPLFAIRDVRFHNWTSYAVSADADAVSESISCIAIDAAANGTSTDTAMRLRPHLFAAIWE